MFSLILCTSFRMPKESLAFIEKSYASIDQADLMPVVNEVITNLFSMSPAEAISAVTRLQGKLDCSSAIGPGMKGWLTNDSKAALDWLNSDGTELNSRIFDNASATAAEFLIHKGRTEEAVQLVAKMTDPLARDAGERMIMNSEVAHYLVDAKNDLPAHLDALTSPRASQPGEYIEKTFGYWIENDPVKAQEWYEKNWSSLSPDKAQFVAAAYATDAARLRDFDSA
ncbi:MAG: hypothetical protein EOP04_23325, partial [Proteobacteria bacterium]